MAEITPEMLKAGRETGCGLSAEWLALIYTRMQSASPKKGLRIEPAPPVVLEDDTGAYTTSVSDGHCDLCAGACRGHSLGHPEEWEPEKGSRAALASVSDGVAKQADTDAIELREKLALMLARWDGAQTIWDDHLEKADAILALLATHRDDA